MQLVLSNLKVLNSVSFDALGCGYYEDGVRSSSAEAGIIYTLRQGCIVIVEKLFAVERKESLQDTISNSASSNGPNDLILQIISITSNVGYLPFTAFDHL
jgi:hypothetical protein